MVNLSFGFEGIPSGSIQIQNLSQNLNATLFVKYRHSYSLEKKSEIVTLHFDFSKISNKMTTRTHNEQVLWSFEIFIKDQGETPQQQNCSQGCQSINARLHDGRRRVSFRRQQRKPIVM